MSSFRPALTVKAPIRPLTQESAQFSATIASNLRNSCRTDRGYSELEIGREQLAKSGLSPCSAAAPVVGELQNAEGLRA
jgi:hypothetical protein